MLKKIVCSLSDFYVLRDSAKLQSNIVYIAKDDDNLELARFIVRTDSQRIPDYNWEIDLARQSRDAAYYIDCRRVKCTEFFEAIQARNPSDLEWFLWNFDMNNMVYVGGLDD